MGMQQIPTVFITCLLWASLFMVTNAHYNESERIADDDEQTFSYDETSERGPQHWGQLNPDWKICGTGKLQSPIDLLDARVALRSGLVGNLKKAYKPAPAVIRNEGQYIMVQWTGDAGGLFINGTEYKLIQCHWHTPSEHQFHGRRFNMELHMVHKSSDGTIAVVGVMYALGLPDTFLLRVLPHLEESRNEGGELGVVNPWEIKFGSGKYFRYIGSLTSPPCTEGVIWTVFGRVRTVSMEQIRALRDAVDEGFENNARPTQQLDGRSVVLYHHPEL